VSIEYYQDWPAFFGVYSPTQVLAIPNNEKETIIVNKIDPIAGTWGASVRWTFSSDNRINGLLLSLKCASDPEPTTKVV
jgi:hypothetical protein